MRTDLSGAIQRRARGVPQSEPIPNRKMVKNKAGGYSFKVDPAVRVMRFLILGSEGGTYYAKERELTRENAAAVEFMLDKDAVAVSEMIEDVSTNNRAARQNATMLALALMLAHPEEKTRRIGYALAPEVCRIGTHWFTLAQYVSSLRGWGRGLRRMFAKPYEDMDLDRLAYQVSKYGSRKTDGKAWSHADLIRLSHANPGEDKARQSLFKWLALGPEKAKLGRYKALGIIRAAETAKRSESAAEVADLIEEYGLTWEMVNAEMIKDPKVGLKLLATMPATALLRNLGRFTANGLIKGDGEVSKLVNKRLREMDWKRARVHPHALFVASNTYQSGHGLRGNLTWTPSKPISETLESAFMDSLKTLAPLPGKTLVAIDCSGSMHDAAPDGLMAYQHAAVFGACLARNSDTDFVQFHTVASDMVVPDNPTPSQVEKAVTEDGGTDCASPIMWALGHTPNGDHWGYATRWTVSATAKPRKYDTIIILTDGETWAGPEHVSEAQRRYMKEVNPDCRFVFVAFTPSGTSLRDPWDEASTLEVIGFDANAPRIIEEFISRKF